MDTKIPPTVKSPASNQSKKSISLALQGGGSHGAFTWGVIDKFLEDGRFIIEGASGTSAGGMNAVALAQGLMEGGNEGARKSLHMFWETMSKSAASSPYKPSKSNQMVGNFNLNNSPGAEFMHLLQSVASPYQWNPLNLNPLEQVVSKFFHFEKLRRYEDFKAFLCATHVASGKLRIFETHELCKEVMLASACLPFLFQAVKVKNDYYWDGGFSGNPAIYPLIDGCKTSDIVVIQLTKQFESKLPMTTSEITDRHKEITYNLSLTREMRAIYFISQMIDKGEIKKPMKQLHIHLIRNEEVFSNIDLSSALNSDWTFLEFLFHWGRKTANTWIKDNYDDIGVKSTAHIFQDFVEKEKD